MWGRLIDVEEAIASEWATRVDEARQLAMLWARVVEAKIKADLLEVELTCAIER